MGSGQHPLLVDQRSSAKNEVIVLFLEPNLPRPVSIGGYFASHNTTVFRATADFCANRIIDIIRVQTREKAASVIALLIISFISVINDRYV